MQLVYPACCIIFVRGYGTICTARGDCCVSGSKIQPVLLESVVAAAAPLPFHVGKPAIPGL
jgi:hypothetical protein